jgi:TM2 domain-containing membrane protein YozV
MANCPFCGEQILDNAKKCKHCHEFLDPVLIRSMSGSRQNSATSTSPPATLPASGICNSLAQLGQTRAILMIRGMSAESIELAFRETEYSLLSDDLKAELVTRLTLLNTRASSRPVSLQPKNRITAGVLALFLGSFGAHKFYLGQPIGWIYLIFFWTYIPAVISFVEAILFFLTTDEAFDKAFN